MKFFSAAIAAFCLSVLSATASANLIVNAGFEDPVTTDGPPFVGFWEAFNILSSSAASNSTGAPRNGTQSLELGIFDSANVFAGVFQDVGGMVAGDAALFSGWHLVRSAAAGVEFRIEWRDSAANNEISRTPYVPYTLTNGADYEMFSLASVVPAGADTARLVYAIHSFDGILNQTVFVDDMSFVTGMNVVPEPTTLSLFGLAAMVLVGARRRTVTS